MPKPIKSQKEHDRRFNADKENFRKKYGSMSLEEIAESGKVRGCTVEYRREYAKGGLKTHTELYKIKNGGKSLEEIAQSSKRMLNKDKWGREK
jgi:hypothetical protein